MRIPSCPTTGDPLCEFSYFSVIFSSFWDLENFEVGTKFFKVSEIRFSSH